MGATPGSPTPVGASDDCTMCTSTFGISSMRRHLIAVEVGLLDLAVLQLDGAGDIKVDRVAETFGSYVAQVAEVMVARNA
jgi:hypothetical protein